MSLPIVLDVLAVIACLLGIAIYVQKRRVQQTPPSRQTARLKNAEGKRSDRRLGGMLLVIVSTWLVIIWGGTFFLPEAIGAPIPQSTPKKPAVKKVAPTPTPIPQASLLTTNLVLPGTLTVGYDSTYPLQIGSDQTGTTPAGFDIDLITKMAGAMGLKANIIPEGSAQLFSDLQNQKMDLILSATEMKDDQQVEIFPYIKVKEVLLQRKDNADSLKSNPVQSLCGLRIGVQDGTQEIEDLRTQNSQCASDKQLNIIITTKKTVQDVTQLLQRKQVDAIFEDGTLANAEMAQQQGIYTQSDVAFNTIHKSVTVSKSMAVRIGDTMMLGALANAYNTVKTNKNDYTNLLSKWNGNQELFDLEGE